MNDNNKIYHYSMFPVASFCQCGVDGSAGGGVINDNKDLSATITDTDMKQIQQSLETIGDNRRTTSPSLERLSATKGKEWVKCNSSSITLNNRVKVAKWIITIIID